MGLVPDYLAMRCNVGTILVQGEVAQLQPSKATHEANGASPQTKVVPSRRITPLAVSSAPAAQPDNM